MIETSGKRRVLMAAVALVCRRVNAPASSTWLLNVNTGIQVFHKTSASGLYLFDNVDPGTYSLTVEMSGFSKFMQENILVQSGGDVTVNVGLKLGSVQSTMT